MKSPQIGVLCALLANLAVVALPTARLSAIEPAANETKPSEVTPAPVKGQWEPIHEGTGGVAVDRSNGDVYLVVTGKEIFKEKSQGIWKSTDRGGTFTRVDGEVIGGRCETAYGLCQDPKGQRMFCFMLDGPSGYTLDGGRTWQKIARMNRGWDFAAVDWSVEKPQVLFGFEHESGGKLHLSTDGGASWNKLDAFPKDTTGRAFGVGVVDAKTLVRWSGTAGGIERSTDTGGTWTKVSDELPSGHVMTVFNGVCYWVGSKGLLVSKDKGATWAWQGQPVQAAWGPYFGKSEKHVVIVGKTGVQETTDGGETWTLVTPLPDLFKNPPGPGWFLNFTFDPVSNVFYTSWMGKPAFRYLR